MHLVAAVSTSRDHKRAETPVRPTVAAAGGVSGGAGHSGCFLDRARMPHGEKLPTVVIWMDPLREASRQSGSQRSLGGESAGELTLTPQECGIDARTRWSDDALKKATSLTGLQRDASSPAQPCLRSSPLILVPVRGVSPKSGPSTSSAWHKCFWHFRRPLMAKGHLGVLWCFGAGGRDGAFGMYSQMNDSHTRSVADASSRFHRVTNMKRGIC
mmetsp:Transcript_21394/g.53712  ORF Transcript_21394/g.53712 Transcript_21394/m.53712 type:complete len:214 (+) Transcript_21394:81-722(+)